MFALSGIIAALLGIVILVVTLLKIRRDNREIEAMIIAKYQQPQYLANPFLAFDEFKNQLN